MGHGRPPLSADPLGGGESLESEPSIIGVVVFGAAWVTGVAAWFLAVAEGIGVWRFGSWAYRLGPCVLRESRQLPLPSGIVPMTEPFETANGRFKLVGPDHCLFRGRLGFFRIRLNTPFPIKGSIRWRGAQAEVEGRIPLFTSLFFAAWLVGWGAGGVMAMASQGGGLLAGLGFLLLGWAFAGGMAALSIPLELRRARRILQELHVRLGAPAA